MKKTRTAKLRELRGIVEQLAREPLTSGQLHVVGKALIVVGDLLRWSEHTDRVHRERNKRNMGPPARARNVDARRGEWRTRSIYG